VSIPKFIPPLFLSIGMHSRAHFWHASGETDFLLGSKTLNEPNYKSVHAKVAPPGPESQLPLNNVEEFYPKANTGP